MQRGKQAVPCSVQGLTVTGRLSEILFHFDFDRLEMDYAELGAHASGEVLRQHFDCGVWNRQNDAITRRKDVARLTGKGYAQAAVLFGDRELRVVARQQDAVIQLSGETPHQLLDGREVNDKPAVRFEPAFDHHTGPVVVAVQLLAAVTGERDEVRGREDEIFFGDGYLEIAASTHAGNLLGWRRLAGCHPPDLVGQPFEPLLSVVELRWRHGLGAAGDFAGVVQELVQNLPQRPVAAALRGLFT